MTQADTEKALRDFVADTYNHDDAEYTVEDAMVDGFREGVMLLPHQVKARQFMKERETGKASGGILADDMGLGKTISTVTRILDGRATKKDKEAGWSGSTLVVCPVALVSQWENEVKKYAPSLRVVQHHGPSRTSDPRELERAHIVVTSYSVVTSEFGAYAPAKDESKGKKKKGKGDFDSGDDDDSDSDDAAFRKKTKAASKRGAKKDALFRVKWLRVVLDEAHNIKNRSTKAATSCCALEAKFRWCLTGTPMQNSVEELYSLIKFLRVRPLNDWQTFNSQIAKPVKSGKPARPLKRLQVVLRVIMLRRTKTTIINGKPILDLPARNVHVVECEFDTAERAFYNSVEQMVQTSLEKLQQGNINKSYTSVLVLLLRLRQACNHRGLISKDYATDQEAVEPKSASQTSEDADDPADELAAMLGGLGISRKPCQLCQKPLTSSNTWKNDVCVDCEDVYKDALEAAASPTGLPPHSSKTRMIVKILREAEERGEGEKTIIFSQFTSMLDLIEPFLRAEGMKFVRYDGSMDKMSRDKSIEDITKVKSTKIILISFKAGSTGLNLTCCNNVILVDPWWNPALEDQAFDRAHRFGQTRAVNIHKLSVKESVEQRILELQEKKRALAAAALAGDKLKNMRLGMDELVALFRSSGHDDDDDD
ncbi:SNF2 family N-terminal domain-containing protein [Epithele typhae]|uniref:SNF2 family N-terminal domain-containing protein n=1 Tax=Epithele typhae TaxID=378194 RepID=UPI00200880BA|nr:SNF2 family N-terminal domain-containing protein [Epithele typhae]KAH9937842.1 SNF2 family N-terminal domain-containing protein [Epithele typhae]